MIRCEGVSFNDGKKNNKWRMGRDLSSVSVNKCRATGIKMKKGYACVTNITL